MKITSLFNDIDKVTKKLKISFNKSTKSIFTPISRKEKKDEKDDQKSEKRGVRNRIRTSTFTEDLLMVMSKTFVIFTTTGVLKWLGDEKNKKTIKGVLDFAKGVVDIVIKVAEFGVDKLLTGLSDMVDGSILKKFFGFLNAITGFFALRWLINPLSFFADMSKLLNVIKDLPNVMKKLMNVIKSLNGGVVDLLKWSLGLGKEFFKVISAAFTRSILKVFGKETFKLLKSVISKILNTGLVNGMKGLGNAIPKSLLSNVGKVVNKVPIVGSLLGFVINTMLGDSVDKAAFKAVTSTIGFSLGGLVGTIFPPAIPVTALIGGVLGDYLGDSIYGNIPKLAIGGVVKYRNEGTQVIVAEKEDEVVIPISMLSYDSLVGSKLFQPINIVASSLIGSIMSSLDSLGVIGSSISPGIIKKLTPALKIFGNKQLKSKSVVGVENNKSGIKEYNKTELTTKIDYGKIFGNTVEKVVERGTVSSSANDSVRGLLSSILDTIVNSSIFKPNIVSMITSTIAQVPSVVSNIFGTNENNKSVNVGDTKGVYLATGNSSFYDPSDKGDKTAGGYKLSTGETYNPNRYTAAAFPQLIHLLPPELTAKTNERPLYFKGKTIKRPFKVKVVSADGKMAVLRINDVGSNQGNRDPKRMLDMNVKSRDFFGVNANNLKIYLVPDDTPEGVIKQFSGGGEYVMNTNSGQPYGVGRRGGRKHAGQDFPVSANQAFQSFVGGTVMFRGFQPGSMKYGHYIDIFNEKLGVVERIAEGSDIKVKVGDVVQPGQIVTTGTSTGVIHYEIRPMTTYQTKYYYAGTVDPVKYLSSIGALTVLSKNMVRNNGKYSNAIVSTPTANPVTTTNTLTQQVTNTPPEKDWNSIASAVVNLTQMLGVDKNEKISVAPRELVLKSTKYNQDTTTNNNVVTIVDYSSNHKVINDYSLIRHPSPNLTNIRRF